METIDGRHALVDRATLARRIHAAKREKGLRWAELAEQIGVSPVLATAAFLGQMRLEPEQAEKAAAVLGLGPAETEALTEVPYRGSLPPGPPTDPLVYRFHELVQVYGTTFKALIEEEFGDGIMSAIDFDMALEREPDPKGDRVRITMSGKFLPYKRF